MAKKSVSFGGIQALIKKIIKYRVFFLTRSVINDFALGKIES